MEDKDNETPDALMHYIAKQTWNEKFFDGKIEKCLSSLRDSIRDIYYITRVWPYLTLILLIVSIIRQSTAGYAIIGRFGVSKPG